jgi:serine/threonine protein kinase
VIGRILGNRYEIMERIGGGGMAIVYRALDMLLNRSVSIKVLRSQFVSDEDFVRRFRREAQAAASLSHPNIVNIYDVGTEGEIYYIVMEYVDGKTLKEIIQERGPLPIEEAIDIAKQICNALHHAHENNIVHRDIKPHNVLISKEGRVKVTDFGIARAITSNTMTHTGSVLGSVHYFSPEQARGGITDVKSDIYSLGVVLYEMVTGELPFSGESPITVALKHLQDYFVEPRQLNPEIPQSVENIILKALAKDPHVRYPSTREMYHDLENALIRPDVPKFVPPVQTVEQKTIQIPAIGLQQASRDDQREEKASMERTQGSVQQKENRRKKWWKPFVWIFSVLLILILGLSAGYYLMFAYNRPPDVQVPRVIGMTYDEAVQQLVDTGFKQENIKRVDEYPVDSADQQPEGHVFKQDPEPSTKVKSDRIITLYVSKGQQSITMPNLAQLSLDYAKRSLKDAKLKDSDYQIIETYNNSVDKGKVFAQEPDPGTTIVPGKTPVKIYVSKGPEMVTVPNVIGKNVNDATNRLVQAGLSVSGIDKEQSNEPADTVIRMSPQAGTQVAKGEQIRLVISQGPPATPAQGQKTASYDVKVTVDENKPPVEIRVTKSDATGDDVEVFKDTLKTSRTIPVTLTLQPGKDGVIRVYQDGVLKDEKKIPYNTQQ